MALGPKLEGHLVAFFKPPGCCTLTPSGEQLGVCVQAKLDSKLKLHTVVLGTLHHSLRQSPGISRLSGDHAGVIGNDEEHVSIEGSKAAG